MQVGRQGSFAPRILGLQFYHPRGMGVGRVSLFLFLGVVAPLWYPVRCVLKSAEASKKKIMDLEKRLVAA